MQPLNNVEEITPHLKNHGGGPKTDAGRARSSQNARTHLIFANIETLPHEHREHFERIHEALIEQFHPQTATEEIFVRDLAETQWRKGRVLNAETKAIKHADDHGEPADKAMERLGRYSGNLTRQFQTTLKSLKEERGPRIETLKNEWREAVLLRDFYNRKGIDWDPADDEFVFSKEDLDRQIKFNKQWERFIQNIIIYPTIKTQDERFFPKTL